MSRLQELARSRGDDLRILAWVTAHASDGDEAAALQRAWEDETSAGVLMEVIRQLRRVPPPNTLDPWEKRQNARLAACPTYRVKRGNRGAPSCGLFCPECAGAIRSVTPAPTWAELTGEPAR